MPHLLRKKFETLKAVLVLGFLYAVSQSVLVMMVQPLGIGTFLRLQVSFSRDFYLETFELWKSQGLFPLYTLHLYPDLLHPVLYTLFLISVMAHLLRAEQHAERFEWILVFPLIAGFSDYVENALQFIVLSGDSRLTNILVWASSLASVIKWGLEGFSVLMILFLGIRRWINFQKTA
jgi:hypothetical protein